MKRYPEKYRAIALDMATNTGIASLLGGVVTCELKTFERKKGRKTIPDDHAGKVLHDFRSWLSFQIQYFSPTVIFYEEAIVSRPNTARVLYGLRGVLYDVACANDIELVGCHIGRIKKHATGNGAASKEDMVFEAQRTFPELEVTDDNIADALHILRYGMATKFKCELI